MRIFLRALGYNALSVVIGLGLVIAAGAAILGWDSFPTDGHRAVVLAIAAVLGGAIVAVRVHRARWLRTVAVYESYGAFAAHIRERDERLVDLSRALALGAAGAGLLVLTRHFHERVNVRAAYDRLQVARRDGSLSEHDFRAAIDELLARTTPGVTGSE